MSPPTAFRLGESKKVGVGDPARRHYLRRIDMFGTDKAQIIWPELMAWK
jgi:hypothetical protein